MGYPFDTVKVLMQTQNSGKQQKYFSTFQCIGRVSREEGVVEAVSVICVMFVTSVSEALPWPLHSSLHRRSHQRSHFRCVRNHEQELWPPLLHGGHQERSRVWHRQGLRHQPDRGGEDPAAGAAFP